MSEEINKIVNWIKTSYTRLNYKEELLLVNYIKQLQQENKKYKEVIDKAREYIYDELKREGFHHYLDNKDIEELLEILKEVE